MHLKQMISTSASLALQAIIIDTSLTRNVLRTVQMDTMKPHLTSVTYVKRPARAVPTLLLIVQGVTLAVFNLSYTITPVPLHVQLVMLA